MYSKFTEFNNLDLYSCQDLDNIGSFSPEFTKTQLPTTFPDSVNEQSEDFFFQKSTQNLVGSYEISFENNFMKEHKAVFERQLQNYMESFRIYSNKTETLKNQQNYLAHNSQDNYLNCQLFIRANSSAFQFGDIQSFVNKLEQYEKLSQFLDVVVASCHTKIAVELIQIAQQLLVKYEQIKIEGPSQGELLELAQKVASCPESVELITLRGVSLPRGKDTCELLEKSKKFMTVYCATAMLVIAQYFENPYSDQEGGFKRPLSPWSLEEDEQEELVPTPLKKRKFSF